jgi:hypothetical protein
LPPGDSELNYHTVGDTSCQGQFFTASKPERFLQEFDLYRAIYEKLETKRRHDLRVRLLDIGKQVKSGSRTWVRQDLDDIASWKGLPLPMLTMQRNSRDFEGCVDGALRIEDEPSRVSAMCDIRGMGPILASTVSMFTWPETCGFMDHHTYNALRFLGFELPRKHYTSRFTIPQLLTYLRIVRSLGGSKHLSSMEIAEALYALDSARTRNNWRDSFKSSVSQYPTMVDVLDGF